MELTKEHFDQIVKDLVTKADVVGLASKTDIEVAIASSEKRIIQRIDEAQEELARMVSAGFEDLQRRLDFSQQLKEHELKFQRLEEALHIKL
jgi:tRNA uridine 5-carbamoylmethylation protein Kti12